MSIKRYIFMFITLFVLFPALINAATELGASTQSPVVGTSFYVQLDLNYEPLTIRDLHVVIEYDKSYLELEGVRWLQSAGTYRDENGRIYIDKEEGNDWRSGAAMQLKFKPLIDGTSRVEIRRNGDSHYSNGDVIGQSFAPVSISAVKPSSSTLIGSLYVKGYTMLPTFSKTTYEYNLTVPSDVTQVEVVATKSDSRQTITGAGRKDLVYGNNRVRVVVTAQDGSSRTYQIMINRTDNRTGDTTLKSLNITNTSLQYESGKTVYETTVGRSVDSVLINALTTDPNATLIGTGERKLEIGQNKFTLTVTSSGGKSQDYTIIINRSTEEIDVVSESSKLSSLIVNNLSLDLSGDKDRWLFGVTSDYSKLNIEATTISPTAKVEILGNENLKEGINVITIKVTETKGLEENYDPEEIEDDPNRVTVYSIIVNKNVSNATTVRDLDDLQYTGNIIYNTTNNTNNLIPSTVIKMLKDNKSKLYYNVVNIYNGLLYQAILENNLPDGSVDATFKRIAESPLTYQTSLPKDTIVTINLEEYFADGTAVKIYTYNEGEEYKLLTDGISMKNGYITFTTNGDTNYVFTTVSLVREMTPFEKFINKYKNIFLGGMGVLILVGLGIYIINKMKNKKEKNEPLY